MNIQRKKTKEITIGTIKIGGDNPIIVQSMTKNNINNIKKLENEINELAENGCELIRIAVPDREAAISLKKIIDGHQKIHKNIPIVADIQFNYELALKSMEAGANGIRINPGNIGGFEKVKIIIEKAKKQNKAIRIGINSGSIDKKILKKNNGNMVAAMVESTIEHVRLFEKLDFYNFKISAKASSVVDTIRAYEAISSRVDYPLHLGVTEAGPLLCGSIKSSVGMGILLYRGIGDTLRVSLTEKSVAEVKAAYLILNSLNLRNYGVDIISCPTCGRTAGDLRGMAVLIEKMTGNIEKNLKIAVMGCIVNGPGEAKDADIGIAFGKEKAALFLKGKVIKRIGKDKILAEFEKELVKLI